MFSKSQISFRLFNLFDPNEIVKVVGNSQYGNWGIKRLENLLKFSQIVHY